MRPLVDQDHYEVLEVSYDATPEEIERAYRLARNTYEESSVALYSVFGDDDASAIRERVEAAWRVLSDAAARRDYDATLGGRRDRDDGFAMAIEPVTDAPLARPAPPPPPRFEAFDDADAGEETAGFDGARLRRARMRRGIELDHIATVTKINPTYLRLIEEERFEDLPAPVYVRGFVTAYAKCVGLDPSAVAPSYMTRFEAGYAVRKRGRLLGRG